MPDDLLDVDDLKNAVRNGIFGDDRQTGTQLTRALNALRDLGRLAAIGRAAVQAIASHEAEAEAVRHATAEEVVAHLEQLREGAELLDALSQMGRRPVSLTGSQRDLVEGLLIGERERVDDELRNGRGSVAGDERDGYRRDLAEVDELLDQVRGLG